LIFSVKIKMYAVVAALLVLLPTPAAAAGWPQPGYGPGGTYYNPDESRLNASTVRAITQRWTMRTHSAALCEVGGDPVVAGGRLFSTDPAGLGGYDPATGARRWHVPFRRTVRRLTVAGGRLLVLSSSCVLPATYQSFLTAFEPRTGARLWEVGLAKFSYDMRVDHAIVALDSNQDGVASTIAYGATDGAYRWLSIGARGDGLVSAGGRLLLRTAEGAEAVAIGTGRTLWQTKRNWYAVGADPTGRFFYVDGTGPGLTAVDAATGRVRWTAPHHAAAVTADGRHVYFSHDRSVDCLDAMTGRKLFAVHTPGPAGQPVRAGGLLYTPSGTGAPLSITDAATGRSRATGMPSDQYHPPVVAGGRLFVTDGNDLRAYY
jgi:outer membrane protein assembly factor BamB